MTLIQLGALVGLICITSCGVDSPTPSSQESPGRGRPVTLAEVGIAAEFGAQEEDGPLAVFHKPLDAAFVEDKVLVLDAAAPWVRVFDRDGGFLRTLVRKGGGPAEAERPYTIAPASGGHFLLTRSGTGIARLDLEGEVVFSMRTGLRVLGTEEACGGAILALVESSEVSNSDMIRSNTIVRLGPSGSVEDTLFTVLAVRLSGRNHHPWFVVADDDRILVYPEEVGRSRLLEIACDGSLARELVLDSLGRGETFERREEGFAVYSARPPFPSGLARVNNRVLWATRVVETQQTGSLDSLTIITAFDPEGRVRRLSIRGWYQLFDGDSNGALLFGNTWTNGQNWVYGGSWGLIPKVLLVDGQALLEVIDSQGLPENPSQ